VSYRASPVLALLLVGLASCGERESRDEIPSNADAGPDTTMAAQHCFQNVTGSPDDPAAQDVLELVVNVRDQEASGRYNWMPAYKDQRIGQFDGTFVGDIVEARYLFHQEGVTDTAEIRIQLGNDEAFVSGGATELGLGATLERVVCR
jgi:hypothetical protein